MPLFAIALIALVVSYVIQSFLMKRPKIKPTALEDIDFPQVEEGTMQAVIFGDVWTEAEQVLWYGNYRTVKIKSKGKK
jgi:hypothetical protein